MRAPGQPPKGAMRTSSVLVITCTMLALANLPANDLPLPWLLAFVLPGAILAPASRVLRTGWQRALLAIVLQVAACWLALELVGPMSRPTALACTILPPLGFATARHQEADRALALFLGFCVLLVGVILDGVHLPLIAAYGTAACLALRCASHVAAHANGRPVQNVKPASWRAGLLGASASLILGSLFTAFVVERTLAWLPSPSDQRAAPAPATSGSSGERRAGLADSFVLGGGGFLSGLSGEQLVRVRRPDGSAVPRDLYLRSGFFTVPSMDRWQPGTLEPGRPTRPDGHVLREPLPGEALHELEIERFAGARQFVFVPPGTCEVDGLPDLTVDPVREWVRQRHDRGPATYLVAHQDLPPPGPELLVDPQGPRLGLLALPADLDRPAFERLLVDWGVGNDAVPAMTNLALGLARHCRYDRIEPSGPHRHALANFLFAEGDRRGYCMHFASAAALLLRLRGIPCRIAVGLFGGAPDNAEPAARLYGSQHAHAWVEVAFEGRGYVVYDPTPPAERGRSTPTRLDPTRDEDLAHAATARADEDALRAMLDLAMQPWLLILVLALALAASMWSARTVEPVAHAAAPVDRSARRLLARLLQALAASGNARARGQTLEVFAAELARRDCLRPEVKAAFAAYQQVRFGGRPFDGPREAALRAGIEGALAITATRSPAPAPDRA